MNLGGRRVGEGRAALSSWITLVFPRFLFGKFDFNFFPPSCFCSVTIFASES